MDYMPDTFISYLSNYMLSQYFTSLITNDLLIFAIFYVYTSSVSIKCGKFTSTYI